MNSLQCNSLSPKYHKKSLAKKIIFRHTVQKWIYINNQVHFSPDLGWFYQKIALIDTLVAWKTVWSWISILSGWTISQKIIINLSSKITMLEDKNTLYVFISKTKDYLFKIMKIHVGWNFSEKLIDIWGGFICTFSLLSSLSITFQSSKFN